MKWELWNTHWKDIFSYLNRQFTRINDYKLIGISIYFTLGLDDVLASFFHRQKTFQLNFVVEKSKLWQKCMYGIYSTKLAFKSELQGSHSVVSCLSRSCIDSVTRTTKSCLTSFNSSNWKLKCLFLCRSDQMSFLHSLLEATAPLAGLQSLC